MYTRKASGLWREGLVGITTEERILYAKTKLKQALNDHPNFRSSLKIFMKSKEAMELAVELKSLLRKHGDEAAHYSPSRAQLSATVEEYCQSGGERGDGLRMFVDFLFS